MIRLSSHDSTEREKALVKPRYYYCDCESGWLDFMALLHAQRTTRLYSVWAGP